MKTPKIEAGIAAALLALVTSPASGQEAACLTAYEGGQRARLDRDLLGAKRDFSRCAMRDCPAIVQTDCGEWLREVERQIPTLVLSARWSDGTDVTEARVWLDGRPIAMRLDGRPVSVNPGQHRIRIEAEGLVSEQIVVANQSERDRVIRFELQRLRSSSPAAAEPRAREEPESGAETGAGPLPWVLGGIALAALGGFTYFAVKGRSDLRDLRESCAPDCPEVALDDVKRDLLIADILLSVGVVSGAAATVLFLSAAPSNSAGQRGGYVSIGGRF